MSREIFDRDADLTARVDKQSYAAESGLERELVESVLEVFLRTKQEDDLYDEKLWATMAKTPKPKRKLDGQIFLDYLMKGFERADEIQQGYAHILLKDFIDAFYNQGECTFLLDYRRLAEIEMLGRVGFGMRGTRERPLELVLFFPDRQPLGHVGNFVGTNARHCTFLVSGEVSKAGLSAEDCEFHLENLPSDMGIYFSKRCDFYLHMDPPDDPYILTHHNQYGEIDSLHTGSRPGDPYSMLGEDFLGRSNRILYPDGKGGWREVEQV